MERSLRVNLNRHTLKIAADEASSLAEMRALLRAEGFSFRLSATRRAWESARNAEMSEALSLTDE